MNSKKMRIGIDLTGIWRRSTGVFRYTVEMVQQLLLLPESEEQLHYVLFFAREVHPDFLSLQHTFEAIICPTRNELFAKQFWFPLILPRLDLDIMHYPSFPPPYVQPFGPPMIMTFYDAGSWRSAQAQTLHSNVYIRTLSTRGARRCTHMVTLSIHAKGEIEHFLGQQYASKISVVPGAVRQDFGLLVSDSVKQEVCARYQLPTAYFLTVATTEPRKNLSGLLDAYVQLRQRYGSECPDLIIVGRQDWDCGDILHYMETLQGSALFLEHVPDQDLIALYQMAICFVFPSLYEGFGLPVLEAMASGCPVIITDSASLPEVSGDAAFLVETGNVQALGDAMWQVYQDKGLRRRMIANGCVQATNFSWEQTARLYRDVYIASA